MGKNNNKNKTNKKENVIKEKETKKTIETKKNEINKDNILLSIQNASYQYSDATSDEYAIKNIKTEYFLVCDPDDWLREDAIEVLYNNAKKNNLDIDDLIESMRGLGYFSLNSVNYAIYESNGTLSAVANSEMSNYDQVPIIVYKNGKPNASNVKLINMTSKDFDNIFWVFVAVLAVSEIYIYFKNKLKNRRGT